MKLVILASGKAQRLFDVHQNCYPKILMNLGNSILLEEMLKAYPDVEEVHIVLNSQKQISQVKEILAAKNIDKAFVFWTADENIGIAKKLFYLAKHSDFPTKDIIISWSDIYPTNQITGPFETNIIFVDSILRHRMTYVDDNVSHCDNQDGNLCGLFYIKDMNDIYDLSSDVFNDNEIDFADILGMHIFYDEHYKYSSQQIELVDTGDMTKYVKLLDDVEIQSRFFNNVEFSDGIVIKKSLTVDGKQIIQNEINFYKKIEKFNLPMPKLLSHTTSTIKLERIEGCTVNDVIKLFDQDYEDYGLSSKIYQKFSRSISKFHEIKHPEFMHEEQIQSILKEYLHVTNDRYNKCYNLMPQISSVNGKEVSHREVFAYIRKRIGDMEDDIIKNKLVFKFIHGDPNTSNTMLTSNDDVVFIDPRGTFGNHKYYGDPNYDHAKFLYGLTGYDTFNLTKDVRFNYNPEGCLIEYHCIKGYDINKLTNDSNLKFLVGLIWLKLPYYTINNINKAIVAYAHGLKLLTESMNEYYAK